MENPTPYRKSVSKNNTISTFKPFGVNKAQVDEVISSTSSMSVIPSDSQPSPLFWANLYRDLGNIIIRLWDWPRCFKKLMSFLPEGWGILASLITLEFQLIPSVCPVVQWGQLFLPWCLMSYLHRNVSSSVLDWIQCPSKIHGSEPQLHSMTVFGDGASKEVTEIQ